MLTFTIVLGLMTFKRLPQGFRNFSAIFQRKLNKAFSQHLYMSVIIFIDDITSFDTNFHVALENLRIVFEILEQYGFSLKTAKCKIFAEKINY